VAGLHGLVVVLTGTAFIAKGFIDGNGSLRASVDEKRDDRLFLLIWAS
jgi:hypothetical protein